MNIREYFFDDSVKAELIKLQKKRLNENIINMHVTFNYGRLYEFLEDIVSMEVEVIIVGYGSDALNSAFAVEISEELKKIIKTSVQRILLFLLVK